LEEGLEIEPEELSSSVSPAAGVLVLWAKSRRGFPASIIRLARDDDDEPNILNDHQPDLSV
jgi:hypothetical protein